MPTIKAMRNNRGAFTTAIDSEVKGITQDIKNDYNRALFNSYNQALATCGTTTASTTIQLATDAVDPDTMKYMEVGLIFDIIDVDNDTAITNGTARTITAVNTTDNTITVSGNAVTTDNTHRVVRTGSWEKGIYGLKDLISTSGTIQNINRATAGNEYWQAQYLHNSGTNRSISDDLLQQMWDLVEENGEAQGLLLVTSRGIRRKYVNTLTAQKRFVNNTKLKGGFSGIEFNDTVLTVDKDAPSNKVWYINRKNIAIYRMSDWEWMGQKAA